MTEEIRITKKAARRGDDGYKVVSVRMRDGLIARLDKLSEQTNRSRNEPLICSDLSPACIYAPSNK